MAATPLKRLSPKGRMALRMMATGIPRDVISNELSVHPAYLSKLATSPIGQEYLASVEVELDEDFQRLYKKVIKVIEDGLSCGEASVALASANLWLKAHGKFVHKVETRNLTAEDIIQKIMSGELRQALPPPKDPKELEGSFVVEEEEDSGERLLPN